MCLWNCNIKDVTLTISQTWLVTSYIPRLYIDEIRLISFSLYSIVLLSDKQNAVLEWIFPQSPFYFYSSPSLDDYFFYLDWSEIVL